MIQRRKPLGWRGLGSDQTGAETVEFLVTLPVILVLFAMIFDFGVAFSDKAILTHATRAAAREVIRGASDADAQQAADQITQSLISRSPSDPLPAVIINRSGTNPGDPATISITHNYGFFLLPAFLGSISNINLSATTIMNMLGN